MAPKMDPQLRQQDFMYDLNWNEKVDNVFIEHLSLEARLGHFIWPSKTSTSLLAAKDYVCWRFEQEWSYKYCLRKLNLLEKRFSTFKWMLSIDGVKHDPETNALTAPDEVWKSILRVSFIIPFNTLTVQILN